MDSDMIIYKLQKLEVNNKSELNEPKGTMVLR